MTQREKLPQLHHYFHYVAEQLEIDHIAATQREKCMSHEYSISSNAPLGIITAWSSAILQEFGIKLISTDSGAYSEQNEQGWPAVSIYFDSPQHFSFNISPSLCEKIMQKISTSVESDGWQFKWEEA